MYKYIAVLFTLAYCQCVFCWNTYRKSNSISELNSFRETLPSYDNNSDPEKWNYGHERTHFSDGTRNDYSSRITFPDEINNYSNDNGHKDKNTGSKRFILKCIRSCPLQNEYSPVCGSDDITYYNLDLLRCVRGCGDDVELKYSSPCNDFSETSTQPPTTTRTNGELCLSNCPTTSEYNPICGTDNVTYKNIGKLNCARLCGVDVEVKRRLPCPKPTIDDDVSTIQSTIETTTINSHYFKSCMDSCLTTSEYTPVCGSNGKTYYNKGKYQCAKNCGLNISIKNLGVCEINQFEENATILSVTTSPTTAQYEAPNKQPVTQNLLDSIFFDKDTGDPELDVRHS